VLEGEGSEATTTTASAAVALDSTEDATNQLDDPSTLLSRGDAHASAPFAIVAPAPPFSLNRNDSQASSDPPPPPSYDPPSLDLQTAAAVTTTQRVRKLHEMDRRNLVLGATGALNLTTSGRTDDIDLHPFIDNAGTGGVTSTDMGTGEPSGSVFNPNLHLAMSSLVNSLHSPSRRSFSYSRRSVKDLTRAQAVGGAEGTQNMQMLLPEALLDQQEELTERAVSVIRRVMDKLTGLDFTEAHGHAPVDRQAVLDVQEQVDRLIRQATASENLCLSYFGYVLFFLQQFLLVFHFCFTSAF